MIFRFIQIAIILLCLYSVLWCIDNAYHLKRNGILTTATIQFVQKLEYTDRMKREYYKYTITFMTNDGKQVEVKFDKDGNPNTIGTHLPILYDPNKPANFLQNDPKASDSIEGSIACLLFLLFCLMLHLKKMKSKKKLKIE